MAAAMIPDLQGTGLDAGMRPIWIEGASKKQFYLVHPAYLHPDRFHPKAEMGAVVTFHGEPITQGGETLTVGLVPEWRRFAIQRAVNGKAEVVSQPDFERLEEMIYLDSFRFRGERADDHSKRYVPNVVNYVKVKRDPMQPGRICPLGTYTSPQKPIVTDVAYDAAKDTMVRRETDETVARLQSELADKDKRLSMIEEQLATLAGMKKELAPPVERATAKCGKEVNPAYLKQHERFCKKGCQPSEE